MNNKQETTQTEILEIFKEYLVYILNMEEPSLLDDLNDSIIGCIIDDPDFKFRLEKIILENQEIIFEGKLNYENAEVASTIGSWIKAFIKEYGTEYFDSVKLSDYFVKAKNTQHLNFEQKRQLTKLFILYRNVKFFPKPFENLAPEHWEIVPIEDATNQQKTRTVFGPPLTVEEKNIAKLKHEGEKIAKRDLEKLAVKEEIEAKKKIEDLIILAKRFKDGSLQRRAIEEEIKKLEK